MTKSELLSSKGELVRADHALRSFRDAGYKIGDAVAESIDNSIQGGATQVRIDWTEAEVNDGKAKKTRYEVESFGIGDNGTGIPANILSSVLTVGFSTRYGDRTNIGRFGVGFKLGAISQGRRLEVYTKPKFLVATEESDGEDGRRWAMSVPNTEGRIFRSYLDLKLVQKKQQEYYVTEEIEGFPEEFKHLMSASTDGGQEFDSGTLIVWRDLDRLNHGESYIERADEKLHDLSYFLSRTYRVYIDGGLKIFVREMSMPLHPYDPLFQIDNPFANQLAEGLSMEGEHVDNGVIRIGGHDVTWRVYLTPRVTRLTSGGGGTEGPKSENQFKKLHIPDNQGKISFLRHNREISYTVVPRMLPDGVDKVDRYIGIEVAFPPALDEFFQVKHIKRGAEPVEKLREELRKALKKPVVKARRDIRELWAITKKAEDSKPGADTSGGREGAEDVAKSANPGMPVGQGGASVTKEEELAKLREAAADVGITDPVKIEAFMAHVQQRPVVALDVEWPGKSLLDIHHLSQTVIVKINRRHPFIQEVYQPIREAVTKRLAGMDEHSTVEMLERALDGIDLLLFAYAKAENMSPNPEDDYLELREDWGKFAAIYLKRRSDVTIR